MYELLPKNKLSDKSFIYQPPKIRNIGNWIDSSGGNFMCNEPMKNFDKLKPEFRKKWDYKVVEND